MWGALGWKRSEGAEARAAALASEALAVQPLPDVLPTLRHELYRARRYRRPLTLAALSSGGGPSGEEPRAPHVAAFLLGRVVEGLLRRSDRVAHLPDRVDRFIALLPETGIEDARRAMARLAPAVRARTGAGLQAGLAAFPDDGFTFEDLLEEAEAARSRSAPDPGESPGSQRPGSVSRPERLPDPQPERRA